LILVQQKQIWDMKKVLTFSIAVFSLVAVLLQFDLMLANRTFSVFETTVRFFSYFTILTNSLVAVYFSYLAYKRYKHHTFSPQDFGILTAITVYITIVGLVYQVLLRHTWSPAGLQKLVDEMLHSVNPVLVVIYWFMNKNGSVLNYKQLGSWLIYPLVYLVYVLIRGHFSGFYPYPFLDVTNLGYQNVVINSIGMTLFFVSVSALFVRITKLRN
jgi:hypothetical protein